MASEGFCSFFRGSLESVGCLPLVANSTKAKLRNRSLRCAIRHKHWKEFNPITAPRKGREPIRLCTRKEPEPQES